MKVARARSFSVPTTLNQVILLTHRICCLLIALTENLQTKDPEKLSSSSEENLDTAREAFDFIYKMAEEFAGEDLTDVEAPLETETEDEQEGEVSA